MVSPEWALTNLTLPILKMGKTLKVIVDSPMKPGVVEELEAKTGLTVELALASATTIRELVRQVYARGAAADEERRDPVSISTALEAILEVDSPRFGISVRGLRTTAWWDDRGTIRRRALSGDWRGELDRVMMPGLGAATPVESRSEWQAELLGPGSVTPVDVSYLADESGREYLFSRRAGEASIEARFPPPSSGVLSEIRLLARSGTARFIVLVDPPALGHEILPHLPTLLLDPTWRGIYINARDQDAATEAFSLKMPDDPNSWAKELESLRAFHFDVVTVDLSGGDKAWAGSALDIASVAFLLWPTEDDVAPAHQAGIRWKLRIRQAGDELEWSLEPLHP